MAHTNDKNGKARRVAHVIAGARKHFTNGSEVITLEGVPKTVDAVVGRLQGFVDARTDIVATQTAARNKVAAERAAMPELNADLLAFVAFIKNLLGPNAEALADFGIPVRKRPPPRTAEEIAITVEKRKATREARGTKGPKAKLKVRGNVTAALVVTPKGAGGTNGATGASGAG